MAAREITEADFELAKVRMRQRIAAGEKFTALSILDYNALLAIKQEDLYHANPDSYKTLTARDLVYGPTK